ncbi:MAG TPA: TatD family hydrolase [Candidatus Hydrogenedens sp.]|nr:TatD family hydrolase [Candidatus Hydrogenedens sp.]
MQIENNTLLEPIDSHCHLFDEKFNSDRQEIILSSLKKLEGLIIIIEEPMNIPPNSLIKHKKIKYAVGFHPYYSEQVTTKNLEKLNEFFDNNSICAIGEIGLDYYHCEVPKEIQRKAMIKQIEFALKHKFPIIIHCRNAEKDAYEILKDYYQSIPAIVLHCYGGKIDMVEPFLNLHCFISFAGNITYPKAVDLQKSAQLVPLDSLLIETDSPYLAPQPVRGKRCIPEYVMYTAEKVSEIKKTDISKIINATNQNTKRIFSI